MLPADAHVGDVVAGPGEMWSEVDLNRRDRLEVEGKVTALWLTSSNLYLDYHS